MKLEDNEEQAHRGHQKLHGSTFSLHLRVKTKG